MRRAAAARYHRLIMARLTMNTTTRALRDQTLGEEIANAISHGLGFLLAVASLPILVWQAAQRGTAVNVAAASVFAAR
jgi:hemolysin III